MLQNKFRRGLAWNEPCTNKLIGLQPRVLTDEDNGEDRFCDNHCPTIAHLRRCWNDATMGNYWLSTSNIHVLLFRLYSEEQSTH